MTSSQKRPLQRTLNEFAENKINQAIDLLGLALPCSVTAVMGSIVTVKFEINNPPFTLPPVTIPMIGLQYARAPVQIGDKGVTMPADAYLGGVSGLGGGTANLDLVGNLSSLVFVPIASSTWSATEDPNSYVLYGPNGVILRDSASLCKFVLTPSGINIFVPIGSSLMVNGDVNIKGSLGMSGRLMGIGGGIFPNNIETSGNVIAGKGTPDQVGIQTHHHHVASTPGESDVPTAGF